MHRPTKGLADLASVRDALARAADERERSERERREASRVAEREANVFRDAVGAVTPLKAPRRVEHREPRPAPIAHQRRRDEAAALAASVSDVFESDTLLEADEQLSWRREGIPLDVIRKLRRTHWIVQGELDLHGARVDEARELLSDFLREAIRRHKRCVRVIHGKGLGSVGKQPILKGKVRGWLTQKDEVLAFCHAREVDGGGGALMVLLRPS